MPTVSAPQLQEFARSLLYAGGCSAAEAERVAESLVGSNLRGYDSHGVMRIPYYLDQIAKGTMISNAELTLLNESETRVVADANWGIGQVQGRRLTDLLLERAHRNGLAIGTLIHSGHVGRLGEYCEYVAAQNMVSMMMVNSHGSIVRVAPPGGKAPRLSTNPLAIGVPHGDEPLILDFSTSATAEGKVRVKKIAGEKCPEGWLIDNEGRPTTDPNDLYANPPGAILPMGGAQAYKGYGLCLMIEALCGALSGGACAHEPFYKQIGNCVFLMILDPASFGGLPHFQSEVSQLVAYQRGCPRVEGFQEIVLPGDPERRLLREKMAKGLFLDEENWQALVKLAGKLGVSPPG